MRDLMMFGAMLFMVPMALMNGFVAFLLWGYTTVLSPINYLFGFMQNFRYNFTFAGIALVLLLLGRLPERGRLEFNRTTILLLLFLIQAMLSAALAFDGNFMVADRVDNMLKGFSFVLLMPLFITSRLRLHATLLVIVLGLGLHGVVEGLKYISSGGSHNVQGIRGSSLTDNNLLAVGMVMLLPLLIYFFQIFQHKLARWAAAAGFVLTILTVLATHSRGGFVALAVVGLWYVVTARRKMLALAIVTVVAFGIWQVASPDWKARMQTIETRDEDDSFMQRVAAWKVSSAIALAHPVFGGGFSAVNIPIVWYTYKDKPSLIPMDNINKFVPMQAHSIYFQVMGDTGLVGFALFAALLVSAFMSRVEIRWLTRKRALEMQWARDLSDALILSLVAFMAGGAGVSLAYYELVYILIAVLAILKGLVAQQASQPAAKS